MTTVDVELRGFTFVNVAAGEFLFFPSLQRGTRRSKRGGPPPSDKVRQLTVVSFDLDRGAPPFAVQHGASLHLDLAAEEFARLLADLTASDAAKVSIKLTIEIGDDNRVQRLRVNDVEYGARTPRGS